MGLRVLDILYFLQRGYRLYTTEPDVYRRQILTYKDGPRAERVDIYTAPAAQGLDNERYR